LTNFIGSIAVERAANRPLRRAHNRNSNYVNYKAHTLNWF